MTQHNPVRWNTLQQGTGDGTLHLPWEILRCELAWEHFVHLLHSPWGSRGWCTSTRAWLVMCWQRRQSLLRFCSYRDTGQVLAEQPQTVLQLHHTTAYLPDECCDHLKNTCACAQTQDKGCSLMSSITKNNSNCSFLPDNLSATVATAMCGHASNHCATSSHCLFVTGSISSHVSNICLQAANIAHCPYLLMGSKQN